MQGLVTFWSHFNMGSINKLAGSIKSSLGQTPSNILLVIWDERDGRVRPSADKF